MAYITTKCPACGALMERDTDNDRMICEYCGTEVFFEESEETKKQKLAKKLGSQVDYYRKKFGEFCSLNTQVVQTTKTLDEDKQKLKNLPLMFIGTSVVIFLIAVLVIALATRSILATSEGLYHIVRILLNFVVSAGIFAVNYHFLPSEISKLKEEINKLTAEIEDAKSKQDSVKQSFDINFIANAYRRDDVLAFLAKTFYEERAFSLQQAYNIYNDKAEANRQEQLRQEELNEIRQLKAELSENAALNGNQHGSAAGKVAGAVGSVVGEAAKGAIIGGAAAFGENIVREILKPKRK